MIRSRRIWEERFHPAEKGWGIFDIALEPNEKKILLIAAFEKGFYRYHLDQNGSSVTDKQQIKDKNGHRGHVIKVSWHSSGKRFATSGTDHLTIIWRDDFVPERQVKLTEIPQVLAWNPKVTQLLTAAATELLNFTSTRDPLAYRTHSTIWCAAWNSPGEVYALGLENGTVSIRDRHDNELCAVYRLNYPIWSLCWAPLESTSKAQLLTVADWNKTISFYEANGKQVGKDFRLDFIPLSLTYSENGQVIVACGADKKVHLLSAKGAYIGKIAEFRSWPLRYIERRHESNRREFLVVCADGIVSMMESIHGKCWHIHMGTYACREALVNVAVKVLEKGREILLPIQESVQNVAVYRHSLAVATSTSVIVFGQIVEEMMLRYEEVERADLIVDCQQLLLAIGRLILVRQTSIQALSYSGSLQQVWSFPAAIQNAKVTGGPPGAELLFAILQDGTVSKIVLDKPFVDSLFKIPSVPVAFDVNLDLTKMAIVGENGVLYVYHTQTKELLFQEAGAESCAWNQYHPDMLAFSQSSLLKIKLAGQRVHVRRMETLTSGRIIGYVGTRIFYDTEERVVVVDVPHTMLIHQSLQLGNFKDAYEIASFGASDNDWKVLGNRALDCLEFEIAKGCFRRLRDYPLLYFIDEIEQRSRIKDGNPDLFLGDILAYRGRFEDAARSYSVGGRPDLAVSLFISLRKFAQAEHWATDETQRRDLLEMRAEWATKADNKREAVELFLQLNDFPKAIEAMKEVGWARRILETARKLDGVTDKEIIVFAARTLMEMNEPDSAVELYERIKDIPTVVKMKLVTKDWDYLLALADREPFHREAVLLPYAEFLVENDRFIEARKAFAQAGRPEEASKILSQLARVSVSIGRFGDASFYSWLLGKASEESSRQYPESAEAHRLQSERFFILADIYNAYAVVHGTIQDPFSSLSIETVFNAARILAAILWNLKEMPDGVRMANVLYVLAVWAMKSDAFKTARIALERLKELSLPKTLQGRFTEVFVQNRTRPFQDPQDLSDFCHTCSSFNPLLNIRCGYSCLACGSPFLNCPVSFEHLPLVEFHLASDITQSDALSFLAAEKSSRPAMEPTNDMMSFDQTSATAGLNNDRFFADFQRTGVIVVDEKMLRDLREEEVVVLKLASPKRWRFLRNMLPEVVRLSACTSCWKIFNHDDFFASILELKCCPFCREPVKIRVDEE